MSLQLMSRGLRNNEAPRRELLNVIERLLSQRGNPSLERLDPFLDALGHARVHGPTIGRLSTSCLNNPRGKKGQNVVAFDIRPKKCLQGRHSYFT